MATGVAAVEQNEERSADAVPYRRSWIDPLFASMSIAATHDPRNVAGVRRRLDGVLG